MITKTIKGMTFNLFSDSVSLNRNFKHGQLNAYPGSGVVCVGVACRPESCPLNSLHKTTRSCSKSFMLLFNLPTYRRALP